MPYIRQRLVAALAATLAVAGLAAPPTPVATVEAACASLQAMVNATASGGTLRVPACVYNEQVTIRRPITILASPGAIVDGGNTRPYGVLVQANDVTIDGLTVRRVRGAAHVGAVNNYDGDRFTFRNGVVRDSSTVCIALHGADANRILDSEMTGCGKEGYFLNGMTNTTFARNRIHHNNQALAYDWFMEAGGGKTMESDNITFDANEVSYNRGPGIWFDNFARNAVITNNRVHHNDREGIFFEISRNARITGNAVWNNGFGFAEWGYGAGITISSSDGATVSGNTVAWNARGITVISQNRDHKPHDHNTIRDNVIVSAGSAPLAGFYDDHGGSLYAAANANGGSGNRYWAGASEPSSNRFQWSGSRTTLAAYNATPGEEGATYLSLDARNTALGAAGIPTEQGAPLPKPGPAAGDPRVKIVGSTLPASGVAASLTWSKVGAADRYQAQLQRVGAPWVALSLPSPRSSAVNVSLAPGRNYRARMRLRIPPSWWSGWATTTAFTPVRLEETSTAVRYTGKWPRLASGGASGGHVRAASAAGASATLTFTGRAVAWVAPTGPTRGAARVYLDGKHVGTVNLQRAAGARRIVYRGSWASSGAHTLRIEVVGTKGHPRVDIDTFAVIR